MMMLGIGIALSESPPVFTPSSIAGLVRWFSADSGITIATGVSAWADKSASGVGLTQATGATQPAFNSNAINGKPGVVFAGAQCLTGTDVNVTACSWFCALKALPNAGISAIWENSGFGAYSNANYQAYYTGFVDYGSPLSSSVAQVASAVTRSPTDIDLAINGATINKTTGASYQARSIVSLGAGGGTIQFLQGSVGEVLLYNRALSTAEARQVRQYLYGKYGITGT